jgi:flagellar protein FlgJ
MSGLLSIDPVSGSGFSSSIGLLAGNAQERESEQKFGALVDGIKAGLDTKKSNPVSLSSSEVSSDPRLPGDFISSFELKKPTENDHNARPVGAAANSGQKGKIDKTSKLYEQSMELESYLVKMMLSSMRSTINKSSLSGKNDFAGKMYDDMMYDELSRDVTRSAGFGLADQVYLQLSHQA